MLGRSVSDPDQVEAAGVTEIAGMGLLPMNTVFHGEKVQTQTSGIFAGIDGMLSALNGISLKRKVAITYPIINNVVNIYNKVGFMSSIWLKK